MTIRMFHLTAVAAAAAVILAVSAPFQVSAAATDWSKKVREDDRQQVILLDHSVTPINSGLE